ncbi:MAG: DUF6325 family protein [Dermatophilaceae bacterium]
MTSASETGIDELGPVDYLVVEFPPGTQRFTGEMADELMRLSESDLVRILDIVVISKGEDGSVEAMELDDLGDVDEVRGLAANLADVLADEDIEHLAAAMDPGTVAGAIVWENVWAAPFASAARRAGGQLIASGRIPIQAIAASIEAELAIDGEPEGN